MRKSQILLSVLVGLSVIVFPSRILSAGSGKNSSASNNGFLGLSFGFSNTEFSQMEAEIFRLSPESYLDYKWHLSFTGGYEYRRNIFEIVITGFFLKYKNYLDDEHFLNTSETGLSFRYRRDIPITHGRFAMSLLPGAGIGWSSAETVIGIGIEDRHRSQLLLSNDVLYEIVFGCQVRIFGWRESGSETGSCHFLFNYRYRINNGKPKYVNDGEVFFPDKPDHEFSGSYFDFGLIFRFFYNQPMS